MAICLACFAFKKQTPACTCSNLEEVPLYKKVEEHIKALIKETDEEYNTHIKTINRSVEELNNGDAQDKINKSHAAYKRSVYKKKNPHGAGGKSRCRGCATCRKEKK